MHRALQIQEILVNIFSHLSLEFILDLDLAALARTCQAFKEPALDILWEELDNLSPLVRCLPDISDYELDPCPRVVVESYLYTRPLTLVEWDILRSYTRRIRRIHTQSLFSRGLSCKSLDTLLNPPTPDLIFPNLCDLHITGIARYLPFLRQPMPSLISVSLDLLYDPPDVLENLLNSFRPPNIRAISLHVKNCRPKFHYVISSYISNFRNIQQVCFTHVIPDVNALVHLACVPSLTLLKLTVDSAPPDLNSPIPPLSFPTLASLELYSKQLKPISHFLSCTQFPTLRSLTVDIGNLPSVSKKDLSSFFAGIRSSGIGHIIHTFRFTQGIGYLPTFINLQLYLEDLRPCMAFSNLRCIDFEIGWDVGLTDSQLLELASSWPCLKRLQINKEGGWHTQGGITPEGLLQLLQMCPSLGQIALAIDTRGYTEPPARGPLASLDSRIPRPLFIDVLDSFIEAESVPAITTFFAGVMSPSPCDFESFAAWDGRGMGFTRCRTGKTSQGRWHDVFEQVEEAVRSGI